MTRLAEWLLDLERIRLERDAPLSIQWQAPYQAWILFGFALLLLAFVYLVYRRERGRPVVRIVTGSLRACIIAWVIILLCRPVLVLQREKVEPAWVAVLVDESHSMSRRERYIDQDLAQTVAAGAGLSETATTSAHSRLDLVRRALLRDEAAALRAVLARNRLRLVGFSGDGRALATVRSEEEIESAVVALNELAADGTTTNVVSAVANTVEREGGGRLAAIVLASDGRNTIPANPATATDLARGRQIPVFPLRIGSPHAPRDVTVGPVSAEENVFAKDLIAIRAVVKATGLAEDALLTTRLVEESDFGEVIETREIRLGGSTQQAEVEFHTKPTRVGTVAYRVEVEPLRDEIETDDNVARVELRVLDDKLRVLYVEGYPRYEYRYLKNALLREETIDSSILLLEADPEFAQEGTTPVRRFPETPDELNRYDVVLFGDVDPTGEWLSPAQSQMLIDFVGQRGGGFALLAGQRFAPHRFRGTPLARLVPVRIDPEFLGRYTTTLTDAFRPRLTAEGKDARLFRYDPDPQVSAQTFESLPGLYWIARTLGPKPGAEVLAEHPTLALGGGVSGTMPLLTLGRYGAGQVLFCATDDTWRWRRHTGEFVHDVFWVQLCRTLMRPADTGQDRRLALRSDRRAYAFGTQVQLNLRVEDSDLLSGLGSTAALIMFDAAGTPRARVQTDRVDPASNLFEAFVVPSHPGSYTVRCENIPPRAGERPASVAFRVEPADLEARQPQADHDLLERLAADTGGQVIELDRLTKVIETIPDRSVRTPDDVTEPLWDSRLALIIFAALLTVEWSLRKAGGML